MHSRVDFLPSSCLPYLLPFHLIMASSPTNGKTPLRIFIFDSPRTNSQVFYKMFWQHPHLGYLKGFHPFAAAAGYGPERMQLRTRHCEAAERGQMEWGTQYPEMNSATWASCQKALRDAIEGTENEVWLPIRAMHLLKLIFGARARSSLEKSISVSARSRTSCLTLSEGDDTKLCLGSRLTRHTSQTISWTR